MYDKLKKKFGQNFLIDENILNKISNLISDNNLNILEIGPGVGNLTDHILNRFPNKLSLVEIDKDLVLILKKKYKENKVINIFNQNILNFEFDEKFDLVISNLPYNVSSQILIKICLLNNTPNKLILMFQKEFGQRLVEKKINSLNSLVNCFYDIKLKFNVSKNCFKPVPKINSSVIIFVKKKVALIHKNEVNNFIIFKRKLFSYKRKSLNNSLKRFKSQLNDFDLSVRPEELDLDTLLKIFRKINL
tara:strand:- start:13 stop:753 length:741 start_codon:yes stop_codon:yes gene_type:complete